MQKSIDAAVVLRERNLKITPMRVTLIETLALQKTPCSVSALQKTLKKIHPDTVTLYRTLETFTTSGIVARSYVDGVAVYDLSVGKNHNHHIVCTDCGTIESIPFCIKNITTGAIKKSKLFRSIQNHTLSFSGTCKKCTRAVR